MNTFEKMLFLKSTPLFCMIKEEALLNVAQSMENETVAEGKTIINKGEISDTMYVIVSGKVKIHDGSTVIKHMSSKEIFGELSTFLLDERIASVTTVEDCFFLKINQPVIYELIEALPEFSLGVIQFLCKRIREISKSQASSIPR